MNKNAGSDRICNVPNFLSLIRILLVPLFIWLYFSEVQDNYLWAVIVLLVSGATDVLDGVIARKFNLITALGKILDPIADKLTQAAVIVCLVIKNSELEFLFFVMILLFAKEFTMLLGAVILAKEGKRPEGSKWFGKLGTCIAYLLFVIVLIKNIFPQATILTEVINVVAVITAICLVFSLFNYYPIFKEIQASNGNKNGGAKSGGQPNGEKEQVVENDNSRKEKLNK